MSFKLNVGSKQGCGSSRVAMQDLWDGLWLKKGGTSCERCSWPEGGTVADMEEVPVPQDSHQPSLSTGNKLKVTLHLNYVAIGFGGEGRSQDCSHLTLCQPQDLSS